MYDYSLVDYYNFGTNVKIICRTHGIFEQTPRSHLSGRGCQLCFTKTEGILYNKLLENYPDVISQFRAKWCKNKKYLPFDFCIPSKNIIIELDGGQHFKQVRNWKTPEEQQRLDIYKMECAKLCK